MADAAGADKDKTDTAESQAAPADASIEAVPPESAADAVAPALAADAPAAPSVAAEAEADSEEAAKQKRIQEAVARGEAPIKPEFLRALPASSSQADGRGQKRPAADEDAEEGGKGKGKGKKRQRGLNKNKDRASNAEAMKQVRANQLCARMAYMNECCNKDGIGPEKCKGTHDLGAFLAGKMANIQEPCPVLKTLGVCPAGLNCRFTGHVADGKNVDRDGAVISPSSEWVTKVPGIGHPVGEVNIFDYEMVGKIRKKVFDFSRSIEVSKAWQRYVSGNSDTPLGAIVEPDSDARTSIADCD